VNFSHIPKFEILGCDIKGHHHHKISEVPANSLTVSRSEGSVMGLPSRRLGPTPSPNEECPSTGKSPPILQLAPYPVCEMKPQSTNFQEDPPIFENNSRYSPSHFQKLQIGPYNFFSPYLCNCNSDFGDSCTKILKILHSFISWIHNTCLLHIDWLCVYFTLGNAIPEPFFEELQDQAFENSQLFFADQQGKLPWTYYAYIFLCLFCRTRIAW
jgi:hypothetical protein